MRFASVLSGIFQVAVIGVLVVVMGTDARAQPRKQFVARKAQVVPPSGPGGPAEAIEAAKQALSLAEQKFGPGHPDVAIALHKLASLYAAEPLSKAAEPLFKRALAIREVALGSDHFDVAQTLNDLGVLYQNQARYAEAGLLYERSLAIREKAGIDHPDVGQTLKNQGSLFNDQGRYVEAEPLYMRSISILEKVHGPDHPQVAHVRNLLADLYDDQGRFAEAESIYKQVLAAFEKVQGPDHPDVALALNNLALLYVNQGSTVDVVPLHKRALAIREKALRPDHLDVAESLENLAGVHKQQGRYSEAEPLFKRALVIYETRGGLTHPDVAKLLARLADLYENQGKTRDAEQMYKRALAILEKAFGPAHPAVANSQLDLALLYDNLERLAEAEPFYKRALEIQEKTLGADHPDVGDTLNYLADFYLKRRDLMRAADYWRRGTNLIIRRTQRGNSGGSKLTGKVNSDAAQSSEEFAALVKVVHRLGSTGAKGDVDRNRELFQAAQWAQNSEAGASLAQMAARGAGGDADLSRLVRERQDLVAEWQKRDNLHTAAASKPADKRDLVAEVANDARLKQIDGRIGEIDRRFRADFPDFAAFGRPEVLNVEQVQSDLRPDEALVMFLDTDKLHSTPEETFIWVVTKTDTRRVRSELGTPALKREVATLRCGLDSTAWDGKGGKRCADLLKITSRQSSKPGAALPFNHVRAHVLYTALFGQVEDLIKGKHLLLVPSGPLTQLPFQVLVTKPPKGSDHRQIAWLARSHALTVLPVVSSLKALRRIGKPSSATKPMIGFGNPLLDGQQVHSNPAVSNHAVQQAELARRKQTCPEAGPLPGEPRVLALGNERAVAVKVATRGGLASVTAILEQAPLPETADELCTVARNLQVDAGDIRLGARATERDIKALSASGALAGYRIVHFATHGVLAGQLSGTSEPGLILTPPDKGTAEDDGYLSAGEIAGLKLDADWVILSACNTAGGDDAADGAEALSGLARAFFYAQARALLVSHWAVNSDATVKLITSAVGSISADKSVGRAEALRRAMLAMIDHGRPYEAHPTFWAPFVVVGEGGAAR